jgi:hypothetical protein
LGQTEQALDYILKLKDRCKLVDGNFVFLWHNTRYVDPSEYAMAEEILKH